MAAEVCQSTSFTVTMDMQTLYRCAVLIYLYCPHKYSITHQKLIVRLVISTPGFTRTQKNYTVSTKILYYFDTNTTP